MQVLLCGVVRRRGTSKRTGAVYDFSQALALVPVEQVSRDGFSVEGSGYELRELDCDLAAFQSARQLSFPLLCDVVLTAELRRSGPVSVVTSIKRADIPMSKAG